MRYRFPLATAALLLAMGPALVTAQQPARPPAAARPVEGTLDIGGTFTTTDGDEARYERYRDTRDGLYANFSLNRAGGSSLFGVSAWHPGYRDQRYNAAFLNPKVTLNFDWASVPLNYSYIARTPYTTNGSTLTLDDATQRAVQGPTNAANDGTAVGVPCAPGAPPASCSNPTLAALAKANRSAYNALASPFDLRHVRDTATLNLNYAASRAVDIDAGYTASMREGQQPWGASFAFNNAIELPQPLDQRTDDVRLGVSWANPRSMLRVGWDGSWFTNNFRELVWDNPIRLTDFNNGLLPPAGPYDPNGYSNGNGPAQGRQAMAPGNMMHVVGVTGLHKLQGRTTINGALQFTSQTQDEALIPWTINPLITTAPVLAAFPHLAQLPRPTAEAEAKGINALINVNTRPSRRVGVTVRYRYNERDVRTPTFDATEYVRFDAVPEEIEEGLSHQYDTARNTFDANVSFTPASWGTLRVGYGHEAVERHGRGFADVGEHILRLSFDTFTSRYVTVRAGFDAARRRGEGFVEAGVDYETGPGGTQPTLRYYDEADRDRTRGSLLVSVMPSDIVDLFAQFAGGRDSYLADTSVPVTRPGELFGLQKSDVTTWNVGVNVHPTDVVSFGASYGRDVYSALQLSRNANPPPDPSWTDPNRNWTLDNDDRVTNAGVYLDLVRAIAKTDVRFGWDFSHSDNSFVHGGPRVAALTASNTFIPLPTVENRWHRLSADVQYFVTSRAGVALGYYFETLDIADFATIDSNGPVGFASATGEPRIDWLGGLITGYGNRPYTGHTAHVRLLYRF